MTQGFGPVSRAFLTAVMFWTATAGTAILPTQAVAQALQLQSIQVLGNQRVEAETIIAYAEVAVGQSLTTGQVNAAGQKVRESGLFETVDVSVRGNSLVFSVVELPTINRIAVEGNRRLTDETLLALVNSESRRVFSAANAEADAQAIADAYGAAGRLAATVEPQIIRRSDNRVDLVFQVTESQVVEVERIAFVGNRTYSDRRLRRILQTKQAGFLRQIFKNDTFLEDRIAFDRQLLSDFYRSRGYVDFEVQSVTSQLTRNRDGFLITFNLQEGQQYRFGEITVASELDDVDPAAFERAVRLRSGGVYSPVLVDSTVNRLELLATKEALNFVRVEPRVRRDDRARTLDVEFTLVRGPRVFVERIDIEGNTTTLDRVIRREFLVVEGDPFNPREIAQAAERIRALRFFGAVDVSQRPGSTEDRVIVDVDVAEQPTGTLSLGAAYSQDSGAGVNLGFTERNFLGRGQSLSFSLNTTQDDQAYSAGFVEPYLLGRNVRYSANLEVGESDDSDATFDTSTVSVSNSIGFATGDNSRTDLSLTFSRDSISGVGADSSDILIQEQGTLTTASVGVGYRFDTRNRGLDPSRGVLVRVRQELAGLAGDNKYVKTSGLLMGEMAVLNEEVTLRATLEGGNITMLEGNSRVTDRFFASSRFIRGFSQNGYGPRDQVAVNNDALGGNSFAVLRLDAEFPLGLPEELGLSGGVFYDIGSLWGLDNTAGGPLGGDPVDDERYWRSSAGVSLFWSTPIGPLRFNFSNVLQSQTYDVERNFNLTISTQF